MASDLKSLAYPSWPYIGTPHEWRGFKDKVEPLLARELTKEESARLWAAIYQKQNFGPELK